MGVYECSKENSVVHLVYIQPLPEFIIRFGNSGPFNLPPQKKSLLYRKDKALKLNKVINTLIRIITY